MYNEWIFDSFCLILFSGDKWTSEADNDGGWCVCCGVQGSGVWPNQGIWQKSFFITLVDNDLLHCAIYCPLPDEVFLVDKYNKPPRWLIYNFYAYFELYVCDNEMDELDILLHEICVI